MDALRVLGNKTGEIKKCSTSIFIYFSDGGNMEIDRSVLKRKCLERASLLDMLILKFPENSDL